MEAIQQEILLIKSDLRRKDQDLTEIRAEVKRLREQLEKQKWALEQLESGSIIPSLRNGIESACRTGEWGRCIEIIKQNETEDSTVSKQIQNTKSSDTVPLYAARNGYAELIQVLLRNGLNPNQTFKNVTMLHEAAKYDQAIVVEFLLSKGARIDVKDKKGHTPLHYAAESGRENILAILVAKGADINIADYDGDTLLHCAASKGHASTVKYLLNNNCNTRVKNHEGKTVVDVALEKEFKDIVKLLFDHA